MYIDTAMIRAGALFYVEGMSLLFYLDRSGSVVVFYTLSFQRTKADISIEDINDIVKDKLKTATAGGKFAGFDVDPNSVIVNGEWEVDNNSIV